MRQIAARSPNDSAFKIAQRTLLSAFRGGSAFLPAVLRTMSGVGDPPVRPLRYPRDGGRQDLTRIGRDMYRAMGADETPGAHNVENLGEESPASPRGS